jgi:hypothetical protein
MSLVLKSAIFWMERQMLMQENMGICNGKRTMVYQNRLLRCARKYIPQVGGYR